MAKHRTTAKAARKPRPSGARKTPVAASSVSESDGLCPLAQACGSCPHIGIPYGEQLQRKQQAIGRLFADLAGDSCTVFPILGMDDPLRFRNKIASPFAPGKLLQGGRGRGKGGPRREVLCGMYAPGTHRIVAVDNCPVEHPAGREVVLAVKRLMGHYGIEPYDEDAATGFLRHVVVRVGAQSGEVLVTLVTNSGEFPGSRNFCRELVKRCPQVTSIVQNVNTRVTNAILGSEERVLYGPGFILDTLCGLSFRISSQSFYQVNARQTEVLYRAAIAFADEGAEPAGPSDPAEPSASVRRGDVTRGPRTLLDAYCGTGTIGLVAARLLSDVRVIGVDKVASSIRDARANARHNGVQNAEFTVDDAGAFLRGMAARGEQLDVLMMDPPRAGSTPEFLEAAAALKPSRIVYISCNPTTQARDVRQLCEAGYALAAIQPVDMFPHTDHVENICLLVR